MTDQLATKPFAGYADFQDCVDQNGDKEDPKAYCATIMRNVEERASEKAATETITVRHGMAALYLDAVSAELLSITPSLDLASAGVRVSPPEEMHVTLCYFPEIKDEDVDGLIQQVAVAASSCGSPLLSTVVEGVARFLPSESSDGGTPYVLLVDPTDLYPLAMRLRDCCEAATEIADDHGFVPHVTQAYAPAGYELSTELPPPVRLNFDTLSLAIGAERHDFKLGGMMGGGMGMGYMAQEKVDDSAGPGESPSVPSASQSVGDTMSITATVAEKAVWTTAYVNDLPDSAFLFIESGGSKDSGGKTEPRSLRHFPVRDANGAIDLPHLRNAIARIPQSNAPGLNKDALQKRAQGMLEEANKTVIQKAGRRLAGGWRNKLSELMDAIKEILSWADYEDSAAKTLELAAASGRSFIVFKDTYGQDRWLSFSSNAFRDREKEIVATKALEEGIEFADRYQSQGPLRLWHVPNTDIGDCDFQALEGRFLVESGTFRDDEMSQSAKAYLSTTDEPLGVSIGFLYPEDALVGGVYGQIRFIERSVAPHSAVANPWTSFETLKGETLMNETKASWLETVIGKEQAAKVIGLAADATKELEQSVAFKAADGDGDGDQLKSALGSMKSAIAGSSPEVKAAFAAFQKVLVGSAKSKADEEAEEKEDEEVTEEAKVDEIRKVDSKDKVEEAPDEGGLVGTLKELLGPIALAIGGLQSTVTEIASRTKALEDERAAEVAEKAQRAADNTPRGAGVFRATSAESNTISADKAKELFGNDQPPTSPVRAYIDDLMHTGASRDA